MIQANPTRFKGFAALPLPDPKAAADELERGVTKLGLLGAMIMGTTQGPVRRRQEILAGVRARRRSSTCRSISIRRRSSRRWSRRSSKDHGAPLQGSPLGFGLETLTHTFRLITSGLFDKYPNLKIIVGHLGETAPYTLWRTDHNLGNAVLKMPKSFSDYYKTHFWLTTSGAFSNSALTCAIAEMGIDRIMFAVDWPYINNALGTKWLKAAPVSDKDRAADLRGQRPQAAEDVSATTKRRRKTPALLPGFFVRSAYQLSGSP